MKYKFMKKLQPYALALGITAATLLPGYAPETKAATVKEAQKVLEIKNPGMIRCLPNGYKASIGTDGLLNILAGIYAGTIKVEKTKEGYSVKGFYSQAKHPEALEKVLKDADTDIKDEIITRKEARGLAQKVYAEHAK